MKYNLSCDQIKRITALKFYYYLAQELRRVIAMMIRFNCECTSDAGVCQPCSLLSQTCVNQARLCLSQYLKEALAWINLRKLANVLCNNEKVIDVEEVGVLTSTAWRTRSELDHLQALMMPYFGIRKIDKCLHFAFSCQT